jgi:hypothetical protein
MGRIGRDVCVAVSRFVLEVSDAGIYRSTPVLDCGGDVLDSEIQRLSSIPTTLKFRLHRFRL